MRGAKAHHEIEAALKLDTVASIDSPFADFEAD